jgi:homoserine kinase
LASARGDEMHEAPRNHLRPEVGSLIDLAQSAGAAYSCWSGAGPAVLALVRPVNVERVRVALEAALGEGQVLALAVASSGLI